MKRKEMLQELMVIEAELNKAIEVIRSFTQELSESIQCMEKKCSDVLCNHEAWE